MQLVEKAKKPSDWCLSSSSHELILGTSVEKYHHIYKHVCILLITSTRTLFGFLKFVILVILFCPCVQFDQPCVKYWYMST
ncbi:hypothetical protein BS78_K199700 [Paspalum vaginatum]|uniref:Uncharacterized protein n=1 Tax=Paspalum vaginatum TaxID=158149 RepID=A0A9W7XBH2_9POAL|nr:hypothetical protein BS78_K199700 [Paspalum vaginatum]